MSVDENDSSISPLNKSLSLSDLKTERIFIEQIYHSKDKRLTYRQYSCEQITSPKSSVKFTNVLYRDKDVVRKWREYDVPHLKPVTKFQPLALTKRSMESITSSVTNIPPYEPNNDQISSKHVQDVSHPTIEPLGGTTNYGQGDHHDVVPSKMGSEHGIKLTQNIPPVDTKPQKKMRRLNRDKFGEKSREISYVTIAIFLLIPITIALSAVVLLHHSSKEDRCISKKIKDTHPFFEELRQELLGQYHVHLNMSNIFSHLNQSHLLIFFGPTGVGKTLTSNIIIKHFQWPENIHHVISPFHLQTHRQDAVLDLLSDCGYNLIIIDSLKPHDARNIVPFVLDILDKKTNVVIITIFNIEERDEENEIILDLVNSEKVLKTAMAIKTLTAKMVVFEPLTDFDLRECVQKALKKRTIHMTRAKVEEVLDIIKQDGTGCKRVDSKVTTVLKKKFYHDTY